MSTLGVDGTVQPMSSLPSLEDGIHLRWGFGLARGFPQYGYYLYRRDHIGPQVEPISINRGLHPGWDPAPGDTFEVDHWTVTVEKATGLAIGDEYTLDSQGSVSDGADGIQEFHLGTSTNAAEDDSDDGGEPIFHSASFQTHSYPSSANSGRRSRSGSSSSLDVNVGSGTPTTLLAGEESKPREALALDTDTLVDIASTYEPEAFPGLPQGGSVRLSLPEPAFRVDLTIKPTFPGSTLPFGPTLWRWAMSASAYAGEVPLDEKSRLPQGTVTLRGDAITEIGVSGLGTVVEIEVYPVSARVDEGWELVPGAPTPITLPVSHPAYGADPTAEDVDAARTTAEDRIAYRDPDRYTADPPGRSSNGSVTTTDGSPIVHGSGTDWTTADVGAMFGVTSDASAYVVVQVLDSERLVLSRPFDGSFEDVDYELADDNFGRLYDATIELVSGTDHQVGMAGRTFPVPVHDLGSVTLTPGSRTVSGSDIHWGDDIAGLTLRVGMDLDGEIRLRHGKRTVEGRNTNWTEALEGRVLRVPDIAVTGYDEGGKIEGFQASTYRIASVESPTELLLERPYVGRVPVPFPQGSIGGNDSGAQEPGWMTYTVFRPERFEISAVDTTTDELTLSAPYVGQDPLEDRAHVVTASVQSPDPAGRIPDADGNGRPSNRPTLPLQYPLDLLLAGSLDAALAQLLGLYWIDDNADRNTSYDYMIVAAHAGTLEEVTGGGSGGDPTHGDVVTHGGYSSGNVTRGGGRSNRTGGSGDSNGNSVSMRDILSVAARSDGPLGQPALDAFIAFDVERNDAGSLDPPDDVESYELPGATVPTPTGGLVDRQSSVGLRWDRERAGGTVLPDSPVMYYLWRHEFGERPETAPPANRYDLVTRGGDSSDGRPWRRPWSRWFEIDRTQGFARGIGGLDLDIGRSRSRPRRGSHVSSGVGTELEGIHEHVPGVRGESRWIPDSIPDDPLANAEPIVPTQTDQTPARPDDWPPFSLSVIDNSVTDGWYSYRVSGVDVFGRHSPLSEPAAWHDWDPIERVDDGPETFAIEVRDELPPPPPTGVEATVLDPADPDVDTDSGAPELHLRWRWTERHDNQAPDLSEFRIHYEPGQFNAITGDITAVTPGSDPETSRVETTIESAADPSAYVGGSLRAEGRSFHIVDSGGDPLWVQVEHVGHDEDGDDIKPPKDTDCAISVPPAYTRGTAEVVDGSSVVRGNGTNWQATLAGESFLTATDSRAYEIDRVEDPTTLHLVEPYERPADSPESRPIAATLPYRITHPVGQDFTDVDAWSETPTTWANAHGSVAPGDREGTASEFPWTYDVTVPAPASDPGDSLDPSPTEPVVHAQIGIASVDDEDNTGPVSAPASIHRVHYEKPTEPDIPTADSDDVFATEADYHGRSYYTFRWGKPTTPGVGSHVYRAMDRSVFRIDWERRDGGESLPQGSARFPPSMSAARREDVAAEIEDLWADRPDDFETAVAEYRGLSNDALRVLASLPENDDAFTQHTTEPIPRDGSEDRITRDTDPSYTPEPSSLHAYVDELDGGATNVYFYRAGTVDAGNNRSDSLSLASPPVNLPDVVPPGRPSITGVEGGDKEITLRWKSNREADLYEYRVYRTENELDARDVRLMAHVGDVSAADAPDDRPVETEWTDTNVQGQVMYYYRVVAVDDSDNRSDASDAVSGAAYDYGPPAEPTWERAEWVKLGPDGEERSWAASGTDLTPAVALVFRTEQPNVGARIQRLDDGRWRAVTGWERDPTYDDSTVSYRYRFYDHSADSSTDTRYRTELVSGAGVSMVSDTERTVSGP